MIRKSHAFIGVAVLVMGVGLGLIQGARAASSGGGSSTPTRPETSGTTAATDEAQTMFDRGMQLVKEGKFEEARERFERANSKRKNNPDFLNMLAYTQRKTGHLDDAFETYEKALGQRPKFPQAREYLGEAHLQAALLQLEVLRGYGAEGQKEFKELAAAFQRAAELMKAEPMGDTAVPTAVDAKDW